MSDDRSKEAERVRALLSYDLLDTPDEAIFDELVRIAAAIIGTPVALLSLVDDRRQWFKASVGLEARETPREIAFCAHAIEKSEVMVVPDATLDSRFADNPLVTSGPGIRFYAGTPLISEQGHALGTLCVIDFKPREFPPEKVDALQLLGRHAMAQIELRRQLRSFTAVAVARERAILPLRNALELGQFDLHYQPQVDEHGRVIGVEALLRWNDPARGVVLPAEFIPLLEESGLIAEVGSWVIGRASADYLQWIADGLAPPPVSVNLSPLQIGAEDFVARTIEAVGHAEINFELTEAVFVTHHAQAIAKLGALRARGHRISIDDFGTGYSSLKYLADLPIDVLKIDRYFVAGMTESPAGMALVSAMIALARGLDIEVVAEGVESAEQRKMLNLLRCTHHQGWLYSVALPARDFARLLAAGGLAIAKAARSG